MLVEGPETCYWVIVKHLIIVACLCFLNGQYQPDIQGSRSTYSRVGVRHERVFKISFLSSFGICDRFNLTSKGSTTTRSTYSCVGVRHERVFKISFLSSFGICDHPTSKGLTTTRSTYSRVGVRHERVFKISFLSSFGICDRFNLTSKGLTTT
jgi:hypothetical protein